MLWAHFTHEKMRPRDAKPFSQGPRGLSWQIYNLWALLFPKVRAECQNLPEAGVDTWPPRAQ